MKRYNDYMDGVEASDTLHERLMNLEEPKKRPRSWVKYGAAAAALVLVAGVGAWGLSRSEGGWDALMESFGPDAEVDGPVWQKTAVPAIATVAPEIADIPAPYPNPDIASEDDPYAPADRTNGGYELIHGELVSYYVLPYLDWADASALPQVSMDYTLAPPDAVQRDAAWDDVLMFTGGEKAMADHLLWDGLDWDGTLWFLEDDTPCGAFLRAEGNDMSLTLEVMLGGEVPSCVVLPEEYYKTSRWQGAKITALEGGGHMVGDDGVELINKREVSLLYANHVGYKLTLWTDDAAKADELCARFVRYAVDGGFHLYALSYEPAYDEDLPYENGVLPDRGFPPEGGSAAGILHPGDEGYIDPGEPTPEPGVMPEEDGVVMTTPYDPNATTETKAPTPPN